MPAFTLIAGACIEGEKYADALELAKTMEYPGFKNNVLARIAAKCAATGRAVDDDLIKLLHDILLLMNGRLKSPIPGISIS